jgi:hypothetical protein
VTTHGFTKNDASDAELHVYKVWQGMKKLCNYSSCSVFEYYGGRGIKVCKRWNRFESFFFDMGFPPTRKHWIERKNNNIGYRPSNCCWSTQAEQARNKSNNRLITINGITKCAAQWAEDLGLNKNTLWSRITRKQPIDASLSREYHFATINGQTKSLKEWGDISGLGLRTIYKRKKRGWEDADLLAPRLVKRK